MRPPSAPNHKRDGTIILSAALYMLDGTVIGRSPQRHRHKLLNAAERQIPVGNSLHVMFDTCTAHKHAKAQAWLNRHAILLDLPLHVRLVGGPEGHHRRRQMWESGVGSNPPRSFSWPL